MESEPTSIESSEVEAQQDESTQVAIPDEFTAASESYIGRWNRLVSTTNWDKGRIIHEWRSALMAAQAPQTEFSDEAWSRMVGGVTGQHAGRLRRVYERFGDVYTQFEGLYWSHFQSALDWDDAEMWLEGALQTQWSVAEMRRRRWQTLGGVAADEPREEDVVATEVDEDYMAADAAARTGKPDEPLNYSGDYTVEAVTPEGPDFGDEDHSVHSAQLDDNYSPPISPASSEPTAERVRPFAELPELPEDMAGAFESFQLAILRQRNSEWAEISADDVLSVLEALKTLVTAEP
ncbi:MAG: hypothetical protein KDB23_11590 [Planctomycetales bacterium]|nr:hypothetical protein [Planctomycetales bacterium]